MAKEIILPFSELKGTLDSISNEPTLEITENGLYNVKGYSYADVNVEGGGGESDFTTAEMTVNLDDGSVIDFNVANYQIQGDRGMVLGENSVFASTPNIINVVLCKGSSMLTITRLLPEGSNVSISGNIEDVGNKNYIITGDCVMTLNNPA